MADLRILQDVDTGEQFYPYTHAKAVLDEDGNSAIDNLRSDLSKVFAPSINLVNPSEIQRGKYLVAGGGLGDNSSYAVTGFFKVEPQTEYYTYRSDTYQYRVAFYSDNDESAFLSLNDSVTTDSFTTVSNAKYARLSTNASIFDDLGVYETPTPYYIPYKNYLAEDMSIEKHIDATLSIEGKGADAKAVGEIAKYVITPEKTVKYGDESMHLNDRLDIETGKVVKNSSGNCYCDYIKVNVGDYVMTTAVKYICLYDSEYQYIGYINLWTANSGNTPPTTWSGNYRSNITEIVEIEGKTPIYARIYGGYEQYPPAITVLDDKDYDVVNLGDSIFGNNEKPWDIGTYIQNITGFKTANCAYGGTTARRIASGSMQPLGLPNIAECISTGDFTPLKTPSYWASLSETMYTVPTLIFPMIDFSKVKIITVAYGTNDYNSDTPLDNSENRLDTTTYCGGLRYAIETILGKYPNITIILLSPIYRYWSDSSNYSTVDSDSDNRTNLLGLKLADYVDAMKTVAEEYHLPFYDNYTGIGLNRLTAPTWLRDGTHLNRGIGAEKLGHIIGKEVGEVY